jgi:formylglycine-generating enzyme required for sulfatase activity
MTDRRAWLLTAILVLGLIAGCGEAEPTTTPTPIVATVMPELPTGAAAVQPSPTVTPAPTETPMRAAATSPAQTEIAPSMRGDLTVQVPTTVVPPSVDGEIGQDEWARAYQDELSDGGEIYLLHSDNYLYLGIRAAGSGSGVGSLCMVHGDEVAILHSSAALGTAVYERGESGWQQTQDFTWRCRSTSDAPSAQAERDRFLQEEGWLANNGRMGVPGEVEYRIDMPETSLRLAVTYIGPPDFEAVARWPVDLDDDCGNAQMLQGPIPEQARFDPETWVTISPAEGPVSTQPGSPGTTRVRAADGMGMVYVPDGTFPMGSTTAQIDYAMVLCQQHPDEYGKCKTPGFEAESPQHSVSLDSFWIDGTEVTNAQHMLCVADGACRESRLAGDPAYNGDEYPVAGIPWQDALDYCVWAGGRLPTEAEWEYAARGSEGHIYPWGDEFDCAGGNFWDKASGCDDGFSEPAPVGSFPEGISWCGALDMAGNVWEWVADVYGTYPAEAQVNPMGPASGSDRVLRGGSWGYHQPFVRTAYRYPVPPTADYLAVGFRCVVPAGE